MPDDDSALFFIKKVIALIENEKLEDELPAIYIEAYEEQADLYKAAGHYIKSFESANKCRYLSRFGADSCITGYNSNLMALYSYGQQDYHSAIKYFKESISKVMNCEKTQRQYYVLQSVMGNLGLSYAKINNYDSALYYYKSAENYLLDNEGQYYNDTISNRIFLEQALGVVNWHISSLYKTKHCLDSAEKYIRKALYYVDKKIIENPTNDLHIPRFKLDLANLLLEKGNFREAEVILNEVKPLVPLFDAEYLSYWYESKRRLSYAQNKIEEALYNTKQYLLYRDSFDMRLKEIFKLDVISSTNVLEYQQVIRETELKNKLQQSIIIGTLIIIAILLAFLLVISRTTRRQKRTLLHQEILLQAFYEDAIGQQRNKISEDIHDDLSSSLAALRFYVLDMKNKLHDSQTLNVVNNISEELDAMYNLSRNYSHNLKNNTKVNINLFDFLTNVQNKLNGTALKIDLDINKDELDKQLNPDQSSQLYYIFSELLSNSLKHSKATCVNIMVKFVNNQCSFYFLDNGIGFNNLTVKYGIGMDSIKKRIEHLNGYFNIEPSKAGFRLHGYFPII
ncbi:sensor histidine kinase [Polluticaenibacter yanchengensis]|uniref:histidine kinase n=1 Tax=Polluticaenibacter yanchengensis TaxID=3014562 RepID=A0ABT4UI48_9BACT|nr:hypothetical protein [Chitinophagaceae bacterium LY-5]